MKPLPLSLIFSTSLLILGCGSVAVEQTNENTFKLKSWGSKNKSLDELKAKLVEKAVKVCSPKRHEFVGNGFLDKKIPGLRETNGNISTYNPTNITHIYVRNIKCVD